MYFSRILEYNILVNFISVGIRFKLDKFQLKKVKTCLLIKKMKHKNCHTRELQTETYRQQSFL